jgi:hypothetical protein
MSQGFSAYRIFRKALVLIATGGFAFGVGSGCDDTVRTTVLSGFQGLATSLVTAVFQAISINDSSSTSSTNTTTST